jgi:hypothetical protein
VGCGDVNFDTASAKELRTSRQDQFI